MSKLLSELLGAGEPMFTIALQRMEAASGSAGVDVRITADILERRHHAMRALGLDPRDTKGEELYHGLLNLVRVHDEFLAKRLGAPDNTDVDDVLGRMRIAAQNVQIKRRAWVLKHSVIKRLLKAQPPRKVMKALGYRSLDSMLKREQASMLLGAARIVESDTWQQKYLKQYVSLQPHDFEMRDIEIINLEHKRWQKLAEEYVRAKHHNLTYLKEAGVVIIMPLPVDHMAGITLAVFPRVLHFINEIRLYSAYFKLQQVSGRFGEIVAETLLRDPAHHVNFAGQQLHWRVVHHHFGGRRDVALPEMFEPHLQLDDIERQKAEETLYQLEPALQFWHGLDFVGAMHDGAPISFNLMDMAVSHINRMSYQHHAVLNMRRALWTEIYTRYMGEPAVEAHIIRQLDTEAIDPGLLALSMKERK